MDEKNNGMNVIEEKVIKPLSGGLMLLLILAGIALSIFMVVAGAVM